MNNKLKILLSLILISSAMITSTTTVFANNLNNTSYGITVAASLNGSAGTYLKVNFSRWSTINVYGELLRDKYIVKKYNGAGILQSTRTEYLNRSRNCYNKVIYV